MGGIAMANVFFTVQEMVDIISSYNLKDGWLHVDTLYDLINNGDIKGAENYIQQYFKCSSETAKKVFDGYKQIYDDENASLASIEVSPEVAARAEAYALAKKYGPHCPYCNSTNLHRITTLEKAADTVLFGVYGNTRRYQWHCNSCNTDF